MTLYWLGLAAIAAYALWNVWNYWRINRVVVAMLGLLAFSGAAYADQTAGGLGNGVGGNSVNDDVVDHGNIAGNASGHEPGTGGNRH